MFEDEIEMALSDEDLGMLILGVIVFLLSFVDLDIAWVSFPVSVSVLVGWGLARFRRRPLPKQIHYTRSMFLAHIRILRNYTLIALIINNLLVLFRYIGTGGDQNVTIIYTYILLFAFSLMEFAGNVTVTDSLQVITKIEGEEEKTIRKKRFVLLFGIRFWVWVSVTGLISAGLLYLPFAPAFLSGDIFFIICQFLSVVVGAGLFLFFYYRVMQFSEIKNPLLLTKAADYYNVSDLRGKSIELLEQYIENDAGNIGILSKISLLYAQENNHEKVLQYTGRILAIVEEEKLDVPHTAAKAHLLRAVSLKAKEEFQEAYEEVTLSLRFVPESNAARKLRRDLRKIIKAKKQN
jgi:hypothetical protein